MLLLISGCSLADNPQPPRYVTALDGLCPPVDEGARSLAASAPARLERLAANFVPRSATRCTFFPVINRDRGSGSIDPRRSASGYWERLSVQRSDGPFDDLVRALRTPPEAKNGEVECPVSLKPTIVITLTDGTGHTVTPAIPADACGNPTQMVEQALEALTWESR